MGRVGTGRKRRERGGGGETRERAGGERCA